MTKEEWLQYAFDVDLDSCSGCKACVSACHSLNGLDEDETWRDVGFCKARVHVTMIPYCYRGSTESLICIQIPNIRRGQY